MVIYYRDDHVRVSSATIRSQGRVYPVGQLDAVWIEHGRWQADRAVRILVVRLLVGAAGVALVAAVVAVVVDLRDPGRGLLPAWVVYAFLFGSPLVLGVLVRSAERTAERGTRVRMLCAQWNGSTVVLFSSADPTRFGQVHRAVQRAVEAAPGG
jgi:hypothetical protein